MLVCPDPVTKLDAVSGAAFLYFERPLIFTIPPQVITANAFDMLRFVGERQPSWEKTLSNLLVTWDAQKRQGVTTLETLAPLKDKCFKVVWAVYPATTEALSACEDMIASAGFSLQEAANFIRPTNAAGELVRHIFLEAFLSLNQDISRLYDYCDQLFKNNLVADLLTKTYFLRLSMLKDNVHGISRILFTNDSLLYFLNRLPVERPLHSPSTDDILDTVTWELFRQIVSPVLDPLDKKRIAVVRKLLDSKNNEIKRLKSRCLLIAEDLDTPLPSDTFSKKIEKLIKDKASREIADLLELDRKANEQFITDLFGDEKTWIACASFIGGLISGEVLLTSGSAVAALSSIGAKAFKADAERRSKLKISDFALLYSISHNV